MRSNALVVLNDQDRFVFVAPRDFDWRLFEGHPLLSVQPRQIDSDRRALSKFAVDPHMPAGLFHKAVHLTQAQTGAMSSVLCGEEWIESPCKRCPTHSDPCVCDRERDILARNDLDLAGRVAL